MCKVIHEFVVAGYRSLALDEPTPWKQYNYYVIGGKRYEPVIVYDAPKGIAVHDEGETLLGKEVEFVL